ncbi:MAG: hypothetical protein ACLVJH_04090 [Faecalibacterium prausnitzii]
MSGARGCSSPRSRPRSGLYGAHRPLRLCAGAGVLGRHAAAQSAALPPPLRAARLYPAGSKGEPWTLHALPPRAERRRAGGGVVAISTPLRAA